MSSEYLETPPTTLPVTLATLKAHLRLDADDTSEDDLLTQYILTATQEAEHFMQREIIRRNDEQALADNADGVPPTVAQYVLTEAGHLYNHREMMGTDNLHTYHQHLLDPYRLFDREADDD